MSRFASADGHTERWPKSRNVPKSRTHDVIRFKSGRSLSGQIVKENVANVLFESPPNSGRRRTYSKKTIASIERQQRLKWQVIVLWVRPGGVDAADKAINAAQSAGVPLGWEPAEADWVF